MNVHIGEGRVTTADINPTAILAGIIILYGQVGQGRAAVMGIHPAAVYLATIGIAPRNGEAIQNGRAVDIGVDENDVFGVV